MNVCDSSGRYIAVAGPQQQSDCRKIQMVRNLVTPLVAGVAAGALVLSACSGSSSESEPDASTTTTAAAAAELLALHAEPDPAGGRIVDSEDREVLLRGANVNGLVEYWQYGEFPTTFPITEDDAEMMSDDIGWNAVRLLVSWSRVEPEPGQYDEAYLDEVQDAVEMFARHGLYSIIDFHQDAWGPSLAARDDEACASEDERAFGWDGAPEWATLDGGAPRCAAGGVRETSAAVRAAFAAFWANQAGPDGVGIRTRYADMVGHVAGRFANEPAVAGYDVMNEPNAFGEAELQGLSDLYADAVRAVRSAEQEAGGTAHLVFFEPSILWSDGDGAVPPPFEHDDNVVFAPHIYRGGLTDGPIERADFERARPRCHDVRRLTRPRGRMGQRSRARRGSH